MAADKSTKQVPKKAASAVTNSKKASSFPFGSVVVVLVAIAVAAFAVFKPTEFQTLVDTSKTRLLVALGQYKGIDSAPTGFDCTQAHQYLTDANPVKGFHVLCVVKTPQETYVLVSLSVCCVMKSSVGILFVWV